MPGVRRAVPQSPWFGPSVSAVEGLPDALEGSGVETGASEDRAVGVAPTGREQAVSLDGSVDGCGVDRVVVGYQRSTASRSHTPSAASGSGYRSGCASPTSPQASAEQGAPAFERGHLARDVTRAVVADQFVEGSLDVVLAHLGDSPGDVGSTQSVPGFDGQRDAQVVLDAVDYRGAAFRAIPLDPFAFRLERFGRSDAVAQQVDALVAGVDPEFDAVDHQYPVALDDGPVEIGVEAVVVGDGHGVEAGVTGDSGNFR